MNKKQPKYCAIYTRVSTDIQTEKEFSSCESQVEKIGSFVQSQDNWQIFKSYSDGGYTGANVNRPALQELLEDIKQKKIDIILAYKIDRLTRSPKDFYQMIELFDKYNVDFISITERFDTSTPAGRLLRNIMLTFAQFERELVSERTKDKMLERARKGMYNGGFAPFGYRREDKKLFVDKKEAEIINIIFEKYLEFSSLGTLRNFLLEQNIKNRQGNPFLKPALANLLRNPVYAGKVQLNNQIYQGIHQPIVSEELFELVQKAHKRRIRKFRIYRDFLFGGLVTCGKCGSKMTTSFVNKHPQGKLRRYYYYRCTSTHHKGWQECPVKQVSADRLEKYILENLERISLDQDYIDNLVFKLNHSLNPSLKNANPPRRAGYELTKACSKLEPKAIASILKSFIYFLSQRRGVERNLLAKKFIKTVLYSQENIKIALFYSENSSVSLSKKSPALPKQGRENFSIRNEASSFPPQQMEFVQNYLGSAGRIRTYDQTLNRRPLYH